jgi:hypothetical protein
VNAGSNGWKCSVVVCDPTIEPGGAASTASMVTDGSGHAARRAIGLDRDRHRVAFLSLATRCG